MMSPDFVADADSPPVGASLILKVADLTIDFAQRDNQFLLAVDGVSFDLARGEILGIVGESGAGKSLTGMGVMRIVESPGRIRVAGVQLGEMELTTLSPEQMRAIRGKRISSVFQDPLASLNPMLTIGDQLMETIRVHQRLSSTEALRKAVNLLGEVRLPDPEEAVLRYPHELSGGMRQRVVIALALCADPEVIIADEPTTALDVSIQAQILKLLRDLCLQRGVAMMVITHDMGVIASIADRVGVMYAGRMVELGPAAEVLKNPLHPYTRGLMRAVPWVNVKKPVAPIPGQMPSLDSIPLGCPFAPRCSRVRAQCSGVRLELRALGRRQVACTLYDDVIDLSEAEEIAQQDSLSGGESSVDSVAPARVDPSQTPQRLPTPLLEFRGVHRRYVVAGRGGMGFLLPGKRSEVHAVRGVSVRVDRAETVALVGESGCGKSTCARMAVGLLSPSEGQILFDDQPMVGRYLNATRPRRSMIFQDSQSSLNTHHRIEDIISEPLRVLGLAKPQELQERVRVLLDQVGLPASAVGRYPHEFSGGQRQRICIARALSTRPDLVICDEPTSALDVSVQAQVLSLLKDLQRDLGISYLFISHDLAVVRAIADRTAVMYEGQICEQRVSEELFTDPQHEYTRHLLDAVPVLETTTGD